MKKKLRELSALPTACSQEPEKAEPKISRNDPCPSGPGKNFKHGTRKEPDFRAFGKLWVNRD